MKRGLIYWGLFLGLFWGLGLPPSALADDTAPASSKD